MFRTKNKLESDKNVCEKKGCCIVAMPSEDTKISQFNQYQKLDQTPSAIYADFEPLIKNVSSKNNPEKLSTTKVGKHIL